MTNLTETFNQKKLTFSFELFPPKTEQGYNNLLNTISELAKLKPDFISCTYGAGGGSREKTFDIVEHIQHKHNISGVAHLTCVLNTKEEIKKILNNIRQRNIQNVLALRGDPPKDNPHWQPGPDNFKYSSELCGFIREHFKGYFTIGVAGFPEGHILCKDRNEDAKFLKIKIDNGADFVITQLFFDNQDYFDYVQRLRHLKVQNRIIPGILPITDYQNLVKFCSLCGASIPKKVKEIFEPIQEDKELTITKGIEFALQQCQELIRQGAPGIHFYCLNKAYPTSEILKRIKY